MAISFNSLILLETSILEVTSPLAKLSSAFAPSTALFAIIFANKIIIIKDKEFTIIKIYLAF